LQHEVPAELSSALPARTDPGESAHGLQHEVPP